MRAADREMVFAAVADERRRIANLLDGLDDAQLATPSLCAGWDVKTVAAHVVSTVTDGTPAFLMLALHRRSMARAIDELARRGAQRAAADIATSLRGCADRRISPALFGPVDPLADVLVHSGDIRIPLRLPFAPDPQLAALAMEFLTGPWPFCLRSVGPAAWDQPARQRYSSGLGPWCRNSRSGGRVDDGRQRPHRAIAPPRRTGLGAAMPAHLRPSRQGATGQLDLIFVQL